MTDHPVLREAAFDRAAIKKYYLWQPTIILACTVVMIPAIPIVLIVTMLVMDKYLDRLSCTLTERTLEIKKGLLNRVESTVPLEKITDLQMFQGPIMRWLGLQGFKLETAGQSSSPGGSLVNMIGIADTPGFRKAVLDQRDRLADGGLKRRGAPADPARPEIDEAAVLAEIRDALLRIERGLTDRPS
jgi:putative membrane protein